MSNHLFDIIADPSHPATHTVIRFPDGSAWTRAQLLERTARYANVLENLGVAPGDRICLQIEKSVETVALTLGAVRAGAVFVPLNTAYTTAEISYFIGDAEPRLLVCDPSRREALSMAARQAGVAHVVTLGADCLGSLAKMADRIFELDRGVLRLKPPREERGWQTPPAAAPQQGPAPELPPGLAPQGGPA